jgi:hypothetical protein
MKILITGSRVWSDVDVVRRALFDALPGMYINAPDITVIHGGAPGADTIADILAHGLGMNVEEYPARWDLYRDGAGPIRNQYMVDLGAAVCLAFPFPSSKGTWDCMDRAEAAGIPVENHGWQPQWDTMTTRWPAPELVAHDGQLV